MKKTGRYLTLIAFTLVCIVINVILFLTVDDARLESAVFWIGWSFAFPVNLLIALLICVWTAKGDALVKMPITNIISYVGFAVYLLLGLIFMYLPIENTVLLLVLELIVTVAYMLVAMYTLYGLSYIGKNQKETKEKVLFIRMLKADVDACTVKSSDPTLTASLNALSESIRFSDPMSHPSLSGIESELSNTVFAISTALNTGDTVGASELITKATELLNNRNSRCIMLK